jgi:hypothetical protein
MRKEILSPFLICGEIMEIYIINKKYYKGHSEYIGRPSFLGNIYSHKDKSIAKYKVASVEQAISKYKEYIFQEMENKNQDIVDELNRLYSILENKGELYLGCWCVPFHDCHGEIIKDILLNHKDKFYKEKEVEYDLFENLFK